MLNNENGYPKIDRTSVLPASAVKCNSETAPDSGGMTYGEASARLKGAPLAYVYSPDQEFRLLYSVPEALKHGTLFEELYKPMEVYGNE